MNRYTNIKVHVSEGQKDKMKRAVEAGMGVNIRLSHEDLSGEHILALTRAQINKMAKAYRSGTGITIKMSKSQLRHNMKVEGRFLPALLPLLATAAKFLLPRVLPSLATGALTGLANTGVNKLMGSGLYIKRGGRCYKMVPFGTGLYLKPWMGSGLDGVGEGLYLKRGSGFVNGAGLILGNDNPISKALSNIPILGPILGMILEIKNNIYNYNILKCHDMVCQFKNS